MKRNKFLKKSAISPGFAAVMLGGTGAGLGFLLDSLKERKEKGSVETPFLRPLMFGAIAASPAIMYGIGRSRLDRSPDNGSHSLSLYNRWFTTSPQFYANSRYAMTNVMNSRKALLNNMSDSYQLSHPWEYPYNYEKRAYFGLKPIEVNDFNQEIWADASRGQTPLQSAGIVSNTLAQTGAMYGSNIVTPAQVLNTMVNSGIGYGTAWLASHTIGALAGLSPESREKLQEIGTWGGIINGIGNATSPR